MYILDTNSIKKTIKNYFIISLFCIVFCYIYEQFSYGEYSNFMRYMFLVPLIGGTAVFIAIYLTKINITRIAYNLWNSGIAVLVSGMLIRGIINISGRYTEYDNIYWGISFAFIMISIIAIIKANKKF